MKKVRIKGIVRLANRVRQEVSQPVSPERLTQLRRNVSNSLQTIDRLLAEAKTGPDVLPAPSRKAYQFLDNLDFESIPTETNHNTNVGPARQIFFPGLRSYLDGILDRLAQTDGQVEGQQIYESICSTSENIERQIQADDIRPDQLKPQSRDIRGWLAYFAQRRHFEAYGAALREALPHFTKALQQKGKLPDQALIQFRPMKGIYRFRGYRNLTRVQLPTPMICFDQEIFHALAGLAILKEHSKKTILEAMADESYQKILSEIELLGGVTKNTTGIFHDLAESFERVNVKYFEGKMSPPRLVWSQTFTYRKFGHYDETHNTIMVSSTLDHKDIPEFVVDFIVYHELLHKKLGAVWNRNRRAVHTAEFLRKEQRFPKYQEAKYVLKKMAVDQVETQPPTRRKDAIMAIMDYATLVEQYKRYRRASRRLNNILLKYLSKNATQVCGRDLGIMSGKTLVFQDESEADVLMDHCIYDYYENGRNAVLLYMEDSPPVSGTDEYTVLKAKSKSFYTLVQVAEVVEHVGVWADDLLGRQQFLIVDIGLSETAVKGLVLATRIIPFPDFTMTSGAARPVNEECLRNIFTYLQQQFGSENGKYLEIDEKRRSEMTAAILRFCLRQRDDSPRIEYQDVEPSYVTSSVKAESRIGRNAPCPCGSGRKYKKCCGR